MRICKQCGHENGYGDVACTKCGAPFKSEEEMQQRNAKEPAISALSDTPSSIVHIGGIFAKIYFVFSFLCGILFMAWLGTLAEFRLLYFLLGVAVTGILLTVWLFIRLFVHLVGCQEKAVTRLDAIYQGMKEHR